MGTGASSYDRALGNNSANWFIWFPAYCISRYSLRPIDEIISTASTRCRPVAAKAADAACNQRFIYSRRRFIYSRVTRSLSIAWLAFNPVIPVIPGDLHLSGSCLENALSKLQLIILTSRSYFLSREATII